MRKIFIIVVLLLLVVLARSLSAFIPTTDVHDTTFALGFVLISSLIIGQYFAQLGTPMITGYLIAGIIFGPFLFNKVLPFISVLSVDTVKSLRTIDNIALGIIAFTAGGELTLSKLKQRLKGIVYIVFAQNLVVMLFVALGIYLVMSYSGIMFTDNPKLLLVSAILLGATAVATSPSTTIAVINETRAKGDMTDTLLGVVILKDVIVIMVFAIAMAFSKGIISSGPMLQANALLPLLWEIFGSLILGVILGIAGILYIKYLNYELGVVVVAMAYIILKIAGEMHLSGLLACVVVGFMIRNFSSHGDELIEAIEEYSLPVYVVFFTIAGAGIDLGIFAEIWSIALFLVVLRIVFTYLGSYLGAWLAKEKREIIRYNGLGFIGQAGVALGFAILIGKGFGEVGMPLQTLIIATIAINQIIGPIALKFVLQEVGEIGL